MKIKSIEYIGTVNDYVYDLETEDGTYYAIENPTSTSTAILLKNTDSCYVSFDVNQDDFIIDGKYNDNAYMNHTFDLSQKCADKITAYFKKPIELEFEKIMRPFLLYEKKRYAYQEWTNPNGPHEDLEYKGLAIKRRDSCKYLRTVCNRVFEILMKDQTGTGKQHGSVEMALSYLKNSIEDLLNNKIPISELIISKSLKDRYKVSGSDVFWTRPLPKRIIPDSKYPQKFYYEKNPDGSYKYRKDSNGDSIFDKDPTTGAFVYDPLIHEIPGPHVQLAIKLRSIDPENAPKPPDRVPFVFIVNKGAKLQHERVAHPDYIGSSQIDTLYYFEHQFKEPISQILSIIVNNTEDLYKDQVRKKINEMNNQIEITKFFKKKQSEKSSEKQSEKKSIEDFSKELENQQSLKNVEITTFLKKKSSEKKSSEKKSSEKKSSEKSSEKLLEKSLEDFSKELEKDPTLKNFVKKKNAEKKIKDSSKGSMSITSFF